MLIRFSLPAIIWAAVIFYICGLPSSDLPQSSWFDFPGFDKCVHAFLYGVLEFLLLFGFTMQQSNLKIFMLAYPISFVLSISYGGLIEIFQHYLFVERSADVFDFLANTVGAFIGLFWFKNIFIFRD